MNTSKRLLLVLFIVSFCMLGLGDAANASDQVALNQICFDMYTFERPHRLLKLGFMDYGNGHVALAGKDTEYPDGVSSEQDPYIVNGNAELVVNGNPATGGYLWEVALSGSVVIATGGVIPAGGIGEIAGAHTAFTQSYRLWLNPLTLDGSFITFSQNSEAAHETSNGGVALVECP